MSQCSTVGDRFATAKSGYRHRAISLASLLVRTLPFAFYEQLVTRTICLSKGKKETSGTKREVPEEERRADRSEKE